MFGELSRRLPSELVVQNVRPARTGLVGNSSGPRVPQAARADRIAEELGDAAAAVDDDDRVPLVRGDPDVAGAVECDPVGAVEGRVLHEERVEAERVGRVRRVAARRRENVSALAQVDPPERAARGIGDEELTVPAERQPVRDDPLRRRGSAAAGGCRAWF